MPHKLAAFALLLLAAGVARADRIDVRPPPPRPLAAVVASEVVAVGTVTEVEADTVKLKAFPDAKDGTEYTVVVVKIADPLLGVKKITTHLKVAVPTATPRLTELGQVTLQKDGKYLLYLKKHPTSDLLIHASNPVDVSVKGTEEVVRRSSVAANAIADPMKALKAEGKEDRTLAACVLAMYYRKVPPNKNGTEGVARSEEESKLLLQTLAEGDWTLTAPADSGNPFLVVPGLGLQEDGWKPVQATPGTDAAAVNKEAFVKWLDGKGKDARVKQLVAKK